MEPLICPQCGGQLTEYAPHATFATCPYCSTKFLIEDDTSPPPSFRDLTRPPEHDVVDGSRFVTTLTGVLVSIGLFVFLAVVVSRKPSARAGSATPQVSFRSTPTSKGSPQATPDTALLRFGATGNGNGQFNGADSIAVDKQGHIFVSDNKLRVQEFDDKGQFLTLLQVPAKGRNYERAHAIDKIAVGDDGRLYVGVGGVVLIYGHNWAATPRTLQVAPDYISDFVLRPDGSMLAVSFSDSIETLLYLNKAGNITRRVSGFHTDALNAAVSPVSTAIASVRIAVDSKGNIFSVYALQSLGSYSLSYNDEDLSIARFTATAKFVRAFAPKTNAVDLLTDAADRLYVARSDFITTYDADGNTKGGMAVGDTLRAFTVDMTGQIYTVANDTVAKYSPIQ